MSFRAPTPSFTNVYWAPQKDFTTQTFLRPVSGHLGFQIKIPVPEPVSSGYYYGENPPITNVRKPEIVTRSDPETFVVGGEMPVVAGRPIVDPKSKEMQFDRRKFTRTIKI